MGSDKGTVVLAPAGYLLDPDIGSDYERPWRLVEGLAKRGFRVVPVAREVKRTKDLGPNVQVEKPPGHAPASAVGRILDRANLYLHARRIANREIANGNTLVVHHLGPCGEQSPSLIGHVSVPFVYGPVPGVRPPDVKDDEWLSWLLVADSNVAQAQLSSGVAALGRPFAHRMWRRTVKDADAVTVEAKANALGAIANAVVIPPGIDVVQFAPELGSSGVPGRVIGVGRLLARKGYDVLIRALGRTITSHPQVHLIIVGDGPEQQVLKRLAIRLGVDAAVTFLGNVPRSDLPSLLRTAEVFCHPATWDNVPFAPLEAMACGLATVVSASGGLPEIVGNAGIVHQVGDDAELSAILINLLSNPSMRENLGKAARARVLERFTWQAMCDSYIELYDSLTAMRAVRSPNI